MQALFNHDGGASVAVHFCFKRGGGSGDGLRFIVAHSDAFAGA